MRGVLWIVLLFAVAVVAAMTLGTNDSLVTLAWRSWRVDLSLNLFLLGLVGGYFLLAATLRGIEALVSLPRRAGEWRRLQRERAVHRNLREAQFELAAARYARSRRAAERALGLLDAGQPLDEAEELAVSARLLAAEASHRLQEREARDAALAAALNQADARNLRVAAEGARLHAAAWALDDRDAARALQHLSSLPPGVSRRTQALRLRLQAARLAQQPMEALQTARLLAKHQAFSPEAARGLLRSLAAQVVDAAHDVDQLRREWGQLDAADRRDPIVAAHAARRAAALGAPGDARFWLQPFWERLAGLEPDERAAVAQALVDALPGLGPEWLPLAERALEALPADVLVEAVTGMVYAERQLWGKAQRPLRRAAEAPLLDNGLRRRAWRLLAEAARGAGDEIRAIEYEQAAAALA
jgi:HemY protein